MSRIRNADEFLRRFREICGRYERLFGPRLEQLRREYSKTPEARSVADEAHEAHQRCYVIRWSSA